MRLKQSSFAGIETESFRTTENDDMAIEESKREDLLRDATAYDQRIALRRAGLNNARQVKTARQNNRAFQNNSAGQDNGQPIASSKTASPAERRPSEVFYGERTDRGWSLYLDEDPVLQFESSGRLRRLYYCNTRYRAENGRLVRLSREQLGGRVQMLATELEDWALNAIKSSLVETLAGLTADCEAGEFTVIGSVPSDQCQELLKRCSEAIRHAGEGIEIATQASAR